jgi:N6-adenosine-specific RNA methylase IME4
MEETIKFEDDGAYGSKNQIERFSEFKAELAIIETFEELKVLETKAMVIAELAKKDRKGKEEQDEWGIFRLKIECKKADWLNKNYPKSVNANKRKRAVTQVETAELPDTMPVSAKESSRARLIGSEPELREQAINAIKAEGKKVITPNLVARGIRELKAQIVKDNTKNVELDTNKKYRIFYADPPWEYNAGGQQAGKDKVQMTVTDIHYPSMTIKKLCELPIKEMSEDNAVLFLWVTSPLLAECFEVIKAWGFTYKTSMIWDKVKHNVGNYVSVRHELLLICTIGACTPDTKKLVDSVYSEERTAHSKKPEYFRKLIDELYTTGKRIELFAREVHDNWDNFGNQI